jgi:hypothetical protein
LWSRAKQLFFVIGVGLIILILSIVITGKMNGTNVLSFIMGGVLGLVVGREGNKKGSHGQKVVKDNAKDVEIIAKQE